jgi:hypothetical protein
MAKRRRTITAFETFAVTDGEGNEHRAIIVLLSDGSLWQYDSDWIVLPKVPGRPNFIKRVLTWCRST